MSRISLTSRNKKAGIALMSVLTVSVILLALAGAFFAAHKTDLVLMGSSIKMEKTKNAALSAAEFMQYKLENDRNFGTQVFGRDGVVMETFPAGAEVPLMEVEYLGDGNDLFKNLVKGKILHTGLEFEAQVVNNLNSNNVIFFKRGNVPPRTARVWITSKRDQITKRMDIILKRSPLSSVSILSGGDVSVQLTNSEDGHWWLGARQPSGNGVRANGRVTGPEVLSPSGRAVLFEAPEGLASKLNPPYGVIQGKTMTMQMDGVSTEIKAGDERLRLAEDNIEGVLSPGSAEVQIPELDADKLTSPTRVYDMPAERITFQTRYEEGKTSHELLFDGEVAAVYDGVYNNERTVTWPPGGYPGSSATVATFDLESRVMKVSEDVELRTDGEFILESVSLDSKETVGQPTLVLGTEALPASIKAGTGITVEGSVGGMGALKAGAGDLKIRAKSNLSTTPDFGIALHSEEDVILSKAGKSNQDGIPTDWDAFSSAYKKSPSEAISRWSEQRSDEKKAELAAKFASIQLAKPGERTTGNDPLWLGLTKEFPADEAAKLAYDKWMQPEIEEETIEVPVEPGGDGTSGTTSGGDGTSGSGGTAGTSSTSGTGTTGGSTSTGESTSTTGGTGGESEPETVTVVVTEGVPAGPGISVEKYVRLREYLKTLKDGNPDETWLGSEEPDVQLRRREDAKMLIQNQLSSFQIAAGQTSKEENGHVTLSWNPLDGYFKQLSNPFLSGFNPDMKFRGLIYAGGNFSFDTMKQGIELEGALVAHKDISISNATGARFIYNSELLENVFATNEGDTSAKLTRAYWAYY